MVGYVQLLCGRLKFMSHYRTTIIFPFCKTITTIFTKLMFFGADMLACHNRKGTGVNNNTSQVHSIGVI